MGNTNINTYIAHINITNCSNNTIITAPHSKYILSIMKDQ